MRERERGAARRKIRTRWAREAKGGREVGREKRRRGIGGVRRQRESDR